MLKSFLNLNFLFLDSIKFIQNLKKLVNIQDFILVKYINRILLKNCKNN